MKEYTWGTGRRKTSVARVRLYKGSGNIAVNGKDVKEYFSDRPYYAQKIVRPLAVTDTKSRYDVAVNVYGGGVTGQAMSIVLGIARALVKENEKHKVFLKENGMLTRDSRMVERKKYGLKKARKSGQFSKR